MSEFDETTAALGDALHFDGHLPLAWHVAGEAPEQAVISQANTEVLRVIASLDEPTASPHAEDSERGQELLRLEAKLDLALDLIGQLLRREVALPAKTAVRLAATGIDWDGAELPRPGEHVEVEVFLDERYPRPLLLHAEVTAVAAGRVHARFTLVDSELQDELEKFIFRHHRRSIAHRRRR